MEKRKINIFPFVGRSRPFLSPDTKDSVLFVFTYGKGSILTSRVNVPAITMVTSPLRPVRGHHYFPVT